jgi:hypothetical protein
LKDEARRRIERELDMREAHFVNQKSTHKSATKSE